MQMRDEKKRIVQQLRSDILEMEHTAESLRLRYEGVSEQDGVILLAEQFIANANFRERMKQEIAMQTLEIRKKNEELTGATELYIVASQELRAVELLKERKLQQFKELLEKADSATLDEMSTLRYGRS